MKILALDPSLSSTGYAIIDDKKNLIAKGKINTDKKYSTDDRIQEILLTFDRKIIFDDIKYVILEDGFVGKNIKGSLSLAQLRGALIAFFKYRNCYVTHRQPKQIRSNFGLSGAAKKEEVAEKVLEYYPNLINEIGPYSDKANKNKTSDIYDAISIGLSYIINVGDIDE